jgi:hypothetical protein
MITVLDKTQGIDTWDKILLQRNSKHINEKVVQRYGVSDKKRTWAKIKSWSESVANKTPTEGIKG